MNKVWYVPGKCEGKSVRLTVTSINKQCRMCMDSNPKPKEKQDSMGATLPMTGATVTTSTRGWKSFIKAARAEIAMGDLCCFHIKCTSITIMHETKATFLVRISCFLVLPAK